MFSDHSGQGIALPNPKYLASHAALGAIIYASGVWRVFSDLTVNEETGWFGKIQTGNDFRIKMAATGIVRAVAGNGKSG